MIRPWLAPVVLAMAFMLSAVAEAAPTPKPTFVCTLAQVRANTCSGKAGGGASGPRATKRPVPVVARDPNAPYLQRELVIACSGNSRANPDYLCNAAVVACDFVPGAAPNSIAFWVYSRMYDPTKPENAQEAWVRSPDIACLGGDQAPEAPTVAQAVEFVRSQWREFVVLAGETTINPGGKTLVNVDTIFSTNITEPQDLPPIDVLGYQVVITVKPTTYTWHFGDGHTLTTTVPGRPAEKDVVHVYERAASVGASVEISWTGTFTVNGGEPLPLGGSTSTTGPETPLEVATASSELIRG